MKAIRKLARIVLGFILLLMAYQILFYEIDYNQTGIGSGVYGLINHLTYFLASTFGEEFTSILFSLSGILLIFTPLILKKDRL